MILAALGAVVTLAADQHESTSAWTVRRQGAAVSATAELAGGWRVTARCLVVDGVSSGERRTDRQTYVELAGPANDLTRPVSRTPAHDGVGIGYADWTRQAPGGSINSRRPVSTVRAMIEQGRLDHDFFDLAAQPFRSVLNDETAALVSVHAELPSSTDGLRDVLTACEQAVKEPTPDPEALNMLMSQGGGVAARWARPPMPEYPERAMAQNVSEGEAVLNCVTDEQGALTDCRVEYEYPLGLGFRQAALSATTRGRVAGLPAGARLSWTFLFRAP